jgi:hypothetical protein
MNELLFLFEFLDDLLTEPIINLSERKKVPGRYLLTQKRVKKKNPCYKRYRRPAKKAQIDEDYSGLLDAFNMR